jgi:hypothetical protein
VGAAEDLLLDRAEPVFDPDADRAFHEIFRDALRHHQDRGARFEPFGGDDAVDARPEEDEQDREDDQPLPAKEDLQ